MTDRAIGRQAEHVADLVTNRHPVDQLADVRAEIKVLREREELLRNEVLENKVGLVGDEYEATLSQSIIERVDVALMKRELGMRFLQPFLREQVVNTVRTKRIREMKKKRA
jgi:hypothetical protein